ncbi:zonular occludens toxin domain-containing protein [Acinetobacter ursingii]|uniref:zonular occludens toxin domain-containing protein n=1 Tax=Acinetobacter ursingii TaxID=108980 RepID=UPI0021CD4CFA|nr:zonular occludens toxin domain-containing protein [Acinetobacter ursingii]MCU4496797.1 zonular occludens toxin domain-containing protein [Acinetobacter ursingii]MCU4496805.1 zonular occludens toxin domain-containing protein [Acinetobacter ursingii]
MSTIRLVTGGIGSAKTLWVMEQLYKLKNNYPERKVYTDITGIKHTGVESVTEDFDWRDAENNSLIIFDEVQNKDLFSRFNSKRDRQIMDLNTIRKRGIELWLITQRTRYLNGDVIGLVNEHVHMEKTGDKTSKVYIWHEAQTAITKTAKLFPFEKYIWQHPEHLYGFYDSIQPDAVHHKRSYFNKGIYAVVATFALACIPAYYVIKNGADPKQIQATNGSEEKAQDDTQLTPEQLAENQLNTKIQQCVSQFGWSAEQCREGLDPAHLKSNNDAMLSRTDNSMDSIVLNYSPEHPYDVSGINVKYQVTAKPVFSGCMKTSKGYQAYTQQGTKLNVDQYDCERLIKENDRPFNYFAGQQNGLLAQDGTPSDRQISGQQDTTQTVSKMTPQQYAKYLQYLDEDRQAQQANNYIQPNLQRSSVNGANAL